MISAWALPTFAVKATVLTIFGNFVIEDGLQLLATKKVEGTVYNYTWKGVPTDSSRGDMEYMDGLKVEYKDVRGRNKVDTKGYQDDEFDTGNLTFGRLMFYGVYGIEEHPTTWK